MSEALHSADFDDLTDGRMRRVDGLGDHGVVVCRVNGQLFAVDDNCTHRDALLSEGRLRGHTLTCPLHGAQFDVRSGEHKGPPAPCALRTWSFDES
ncbi:MAG: non-heme iron oxygenase ferredoxin subunit [Actinomycetota bacterium]|nr:non-heme iron oxygenase ferredoxin subunit [Actinomycetota bacterium]